MASPYSAEMSALYRKARKQGMPSVSDEATLLADVVTPTTQPVTTLVGASEVDTRYYRSPQAKAKAAARRAKVGAARAYDIIG